MGRYGYYTHYQEPGFGLLQLGVRYYDPTIGRFTQRDPARSDWNWYGYSGGRPLSMIDPHGLIAIPSCAGIWAPLILKYWNYFKFYFNGTGEDRDLVELGIHKEFWHSRPVTAQTKAFTARLRSEVRRAVKAHASSACKGRKYARLELPGISTGRIPVDVTFIDKLFPLGQTTVQLTGNCHILLDCCRRNYRFSCDHRYRMQDAFEDVRDWHWRFLPPQEGNQELPCGVGYGIVGSMNTVSSGTGNF